MITQDGNHFPQRASFDTVVDMANEKRRVLIADSQLRSSSFGIKSSDKPEFSSAGRGVLAHALDESRFLLQHAAAAMQTLHEQISNTHSMVVLTSANGLVLKSLGDIDFLEKAAQVALAPGFDWSEKINGTNAIGTALREEQSMIVHGGEHFMNANKFLTCACAPISDPYGRLIGALDLTSDYRSFQQHTMALVKMSVQMIENHMFEDISSKGVVIHFHARAEFIGTLVDGIAVFSADGRFLSANRSAQFQLGLSFNALSAHTFSSLFGIPMSRLYALCRGTLTKLHSLCLYNGVTVSCRVDITSSGQFFTGQEILPKPAIDAASITREPLSPSLTPKSKLSTLRYLDTGDAQIAAVIQKLRLVRGRDIPIMILGETGTGKELMAQAIHGDSERSSAPFVCVNCASIPESLIESELFGYESGAFTGAREKGVIGKIQQANGGTLFLDEIGDMPRNLQARLLRVLQERRISPLGAGREIAVDISILCATNKNLKEMIACGEFRQDLYYRLNGLVVRLPALRERTDFKFVVSKIISSLSTYSKPVDLSDEVMEMFQRYQWPGNFRQLHNLLRTAVVMSGDTGTIERLHLPDDFLEEIAVLPCVDTFDIPAVTGALTNTKPAINPFANVANVADITKPAARLEEVTTLAIAQMLRQHKGNVSSAAKALGISRNTIYRKKHQLPADVWD
ncbi:Acetoin catabolism regulatory protein [Polaromonas vacuolata]|uniref:Acetoin catabolism regulatory protein n=1 Tax=Polaromonas vacuolata TaxID=37448 RepID=A0A6H2H7P7_9BURK|nr:sigma-54-dependent Fis family transcriptional regulator [Polaromonas vacuolata]QJC55885.1 Acetoin catabolism regulatory protein [Polaromonas vacuolata]